MTDARLRDLERRWGESGAPDDEVLYLRERLRSEEPSQEILWRLLQLLPPGDPGRAEHADALLELARELEADEAPPGAQEGSSPRRVGASLLEGVGAWNQHGCFRAWTQGRASTLWLLGPRAGPHRPDPAQIEADLNACLELRNANLLELRGWSRSPRLHLIAGAAPERSTPLSSLAAPLGQDEAVRILRRLAEALAVGHARDLAHGEISASSVVLDADGEPLLRPFGEFYLQELERAANLDAGVEGVVAGPLHERCPEELQGRRLTPRSDIFQLGLLAYWLLVGKQPFQGSTHMETLQLILTEDPPFLGERRLDELFELALARNPHDRFPSVGDFVDALGEL